MGDCEIHEKIEVSKNTVPDATYKRTYWLIRGEAKLSIGSYENESSVGVVKEPYAVDECIVIPTSCYVYLVEPDDQVSVFDPYKADQWWSFAEPRGINGHYDYHVDTVRRMEGTWKLSYVLESGLNGRRPDVIHFVTKDNWQSFQIETDEQELGKYRRQTACTDKPMHVTARPPRMMGAVTPRPVRSTHTSRDASRNKDRISAH